MLFTDDIKDCERLMAVHSPETLQGALVKEHLASALKQSIMQGELTPGQRVIEGQWAKAFGVAQASVREAINLLIAEGFLVKDAGRSARVVNYDEHDVAQVYAVRGALEGLAAELACARGADVTYLETALHRMKRAAQAGDMKALIESDLEFHICLADASENPVLIDALRRLLSPLFAFILMRVLKSGQGPDAWTADLPRHEQIIELVREGNGALARQYVQHAITRFVKSAYRVWENVGGAVEAHSKGSDGARSRRRNARL
jgi:DNA-binding GntR family transcriptional regulator